MVAIVLGILKIIGILLLVILGLLLFVIVSVLFVPLRYRAEGSFYEKLKGSASASWFLHLISLKVSYDEKAQVDVRVLWFHPGREKAEKAQDRAETPERAEPVTGHASAGFPEGADETEKSEADAFEKELTERVETAQVSAPPGTDRHERKNAGAGKITARFRHFLSALKLKVQRIRRNLKKAAKKLQTGKDRWETILSFLRNEENKKTFRLAKRQIFAVIRHILPRKSEGKIRFGFDDPYMTGQVLTWISPFYGLYGRHLQICPDFLEPCLEGEWKLKGHIRLGTILLLAFRMLLDKNIRLWIRAARGRKEKG